jgi:hypothetical protein
VDHTDGNRANNCRFNLRKCTLAENQRNKRKSHAGRSRYKGVTYDKDRNKWFARCRMGKNRVRRGCYDNELDAARAYDYAAVASFGPYARPNLPEEWPPERRAQVYAEHQAAVKRAKKKKGRGPRDEGRGGSSKSSNARGSQGRGARRAGGTVLAPAHDPQAPGPEGRVREKKERDRGDREVA